MIQTIPLVRNSRLNKTLRTRVLTCSALALIAGVLGVSWSVQAEILPWSVFWSAPVLSNPAEKPSSEADPQQEDRENRAINLLMYRDRDRERLLFHAQDQLLDGDVASGLEYLQRILDLDEDLFIWRKSDQKLVSLRSEASRLLESLDATNLTRYQRLVDADAESLFKEATRQNDPYLFERVAQRYFHTMQGFRATHWCATRWFDHGYFDRAARAWESLERHTYHREQVTRVMRAKCQLARRLAEKASPQPKPLIRLASNQIYPVGTTGPRLDVNPPIHADTEPSHSPNWLTFQGGSGRTKSTAATTPFLNPDWIVSYPENGSKTVNATLALWEGKQEKALSAKATAYFPIVVDEHVIFRDYRGIRCIDRKTGKRLWAYRCFTSLQNELDRLDAKHGAGGVHSSRSGSYVQMQSEYAGNSVLGLLSSDGACVFVVDNMVLGSSAQESEDSKSRDPRKSNQLLALPLHPRTESKIQPVWVVGGRNEKHSVEPALVGHFFRGPPLPVDGRLYVITENRNQLNLVAMDAASGKLLWKQGIAFANETFEVDHHRYPLACPIAFGSGVLVCPTQTGLLVGVDAMTGTLLWSYCYAEELYRSNRRGWRDRYQKTWGSDGFPSAPKICGRQVVLLPRQSNEIHCLDVRTGRRIWTRPRNDAEYIGAISEQLVFVVGQRYCRGLERSSGEELWTTRIGMPAGQGVFAEGQYLLPLESGRIATIQLDTGREIGLSGWRNTRLADKKESNPKLDLTSSVGLPAKRLPENWHAGNLIPAGDQILACGPLGLVAFPQTGELLNRRVRSRLIVSPADLSTRLLAAELQLNLGELAAAKSNLETVLAIQKSHQLRPHGELLMRELLFRQLENEPGFALPILDELESLVSSPADRGRFLMRKAEYQLRMGEPLGVWKTAQALVELDYHDVLPWPRNPDHTVAPRIYATHLMKHLRDQLSVSELIHIEQQVERECQAILNDGTEIAMQRFLALYELWPQSAEVRQHLAMFLQSRGEYQHAEFLWLKNRESEDLVVVAEATRHLMDLWNQLGLYSEAAMLAEELASPKFEAVRLSDGLTPVDLLAAVASGDMLRLAITRRTLPSYRTNRVRITEHRWTPTEKNLLDAFSQYRREFSLLPGSSFQLLDKGWVDEKTGEQAETRIAVIDRTSGLIQGKVRIPLRNSYPSLSKRAHVGHFFPVGSINRMTGVSLLEIENEKPLWKSQLGKGAAYQHILRPGPAGPGFCTFQGQQQLLVVDPATGQSLWERSDIDHSSGLVSDPYAGLFGDADVLVMFNSDRSAYTVFRTETGEEIHHGELDIDTGQIRRIFGRKLFYITHTQEGRRMRIWDFGKNEMVFDQPAGNRIYSALTPDHELVVLIPPHPDETEEKPSRLQIRDVINDKVLLDLEVPEDELKNLNYVRGFRHGGKFYVNLQRSVQMPAERLFSYYASDAFPPVENIQGDLMAIDPVSEKVLWKRTLPQRSILQMPHIGLPFLVMISRVRDRWQGGKQGLLVEVLDSETGDTLARKDNNLSDRVVNLAYDREKGVLDLNGLKTRVRLNFGPAIAPRPKEDEPF